VLDDAGGGGEPHLPHPPGLLREQRHEPPSSLLARMAATSLDLVGVSSSAPEPRTSSGHEAYGIPFPERPHERSTCARPDVLRPAGGPWTTRAPAAGTLSAPSPAPASSSPATAEPIAARHGDA
jgi:hypothetical protein